MKLYQLYEQVNINSADELANAFTSEEWLRIVNYFLETNGRWSSDDPEAEHPLGSDRDEIRARMIAINRTIGANQPSRQTPGMWVMKAARFGMSDTGDRTPNWNEIYAHLAPHKDYRLPPGWNTPGLGDVTGNVTGERNFPLETGTWIDTDVTQWNNFSDLREDYLIPWFTEAIRRKAEEYPRTNSNDVNIFHAWISAPNNFDQQMSEALLDTERSSFARRIQQDGSISKNVVDQRLYQWLVSANGNYLRWVRDQDLGND